MGSDDEIHVSRPTPHPAGLSGLLNDALDDIRAVRRADPAATRPLEVVLAYPGLHALWFHRVAHRFWKRGWVVTARLLSHLSRHYTGIEIHPGATIGRRVFIDHGMGVVIGETAEVGDDCLIYKGVVLGGTTLRRTKRHPTIGKGVTIGSNACILGSVKVGDGATIGSGSVVVDDVNVGATVVGIPGRVVSRERPHELQIPNLDHASMPDPLQHIVEELLGHIGRLSSRIDTLEALLELESDELSEHLDEYEDNSDIDLDFLKSRESTSS
jgi:serine O-acetyltransferase